MIKKRRLVISVLLLVFFSGLLLYFSSLSIAAPQDALLPQVAAIVRHPQQPDEAALKQDVYVALLAFDAPEDMDYMAIGAQVAQRNFNRLRKALSAQETALMLDADSAENHYGKNKPLALDLTVGKARFKFPCADIDAYQCATTTLSQQATIKSLSERNKTLMGRYTQTVKLPNYGIYSYAVMDPLPHYGPVIWLTDLRLAQALMAFAAGEVDKGFALLSAEMAFSKRMLAEDKTLIGQMIAIRRLYSIYHVISVTMEMPAARTQLNSSTMSALLAPLTAAEQKGMAQAIVSERNMGLFLFYSNRLKGIEMVSDAISQETEAAKKEVFNLGYDRYASSNIHYLMFELLIQRASLTTEEVSRLMVSRQLKSVDAQMQAVLTHQLALAKKNGAPDNRLGETLLKMTSPRWEDYLHRFYNIQAYRALVDAKRQILQGGVKAGEVGAVVQSGGAKMRNPYTQAPFQWNAKTQILSTPRLFANEIVAGKNKELTVRIDLKN